MIGNLDYGFLADIYTDYRNSLHDSGNTPEEFHVGGGDCYKSGGYVGLYASFGLNTYYLVTAFIGLWHWRRDKKAYSADVQPDGQGGDVIILNRLSWKTVVISAAVIITGTAALSSGMEWMNAQGFLKENPMSLLDSGVAVLSAVATWWLVKSYIQQWWLWIVADTLSVILCAMQGMWWMAVLYVAYVAAAAYGLVYWKTRGVYLSDY